MNSSPSLPWDIPADWPAPDADARALSARLIELIRTEIDQAQGFLDFARFMELALYAPGLGYYSAGARKFGAGGDFVTAPEVSPLFAQCIANSWVSVRRQLGGGDILELGAGSGAMAADLLAQLERLDQLPDRYCILERSADLRERQRLHLAQAVPQLLARVQWLDAPPTAAWRGLLVANEVLDALPVNLFHWHLDQVNELGVTWQGATFGPVERPAPEALRVLVESWAQQLEWRGDYRSECNLSLTPWLQSVTAQLDAGAALLIDCGYPRHEYYHPERAQGTLLCHYRHRAHADALLLPGLQDITAHVDFTAVAEAADHCGMTVSGFTTQGHFLIDAGIEQMLSDAQNHTAGDYLRIVTQAKTLLLPGEMGERFKCMLLTRALEPGIRGFGGRDLRGRL